METPRPRPRRVVSRRRYRVRVAAVASVVDSRARALGGERRAERKTLGRALHRGVVERAGRSFHRGRVQGSLRDGVHVLRVPGVRRRALGRVGLGGADGRCAVDVRYVRRGTRFGVQLCVQPVAALFPECASTVMSALSGAFQVSGLVFLALTAGDEREIAFYVFSGAAVVLFCLCYVMLPRGQSFGGGRRGRVDDVGTPSGGRPTGTRERNSYDRPSISGSSPGSPSSCVRCSFTSPPSGTRSKPRVTRRGNIRAFFQRAYGAARPSSRRWADASRINRAGRVSGLGHGLGRALVRHPVPSQERRSGRAGVRDDHVQFGRLFVFAMYFSNVGRRFGFVHYGTLCGLGLLISAIWEFDSVSTALVGGRKRAERRERALLRHVLRHAPVRRVAQSTRGGGTRRTSIA